MHLYWGHYHKLQNKWRRWLSLNGITGCSYKSFEYATLKAWNVTANYLNEIWMWRTKRNQWEKQMMWIHDTKQAELKVKTNLDQGDIVSSLQRVENLWTQKNQNMTWTISLFYSEMKTTKRILFAEYLYRKSLTTLLTLGVQKYMYNCTL